MRLAWAFLRRDLKIASAYRSALFFGGAGGLFTLTVFYFLARAVGPMPLLARYGVDYFSFALVGLSVATALRTVQTSFARALRESQLDGSLEVLLAAPLTTTGVLARLGIYPTLMALVRGLVLLGAGALLFGARLQLSALSFAVTLALALAAFGALGLLSAAFVLAFKRADPFTYALDALSYLLAGVVYPVEVLPAWLRAISQALPATHALAALRRAALQHAGAAQLWREWTILLGFCAVLWPVAALALAYARRHVEQAGTLPHA